MNHKFFFHTELLRTLFWISACILCSQNVNAGLVIADNQLYLDRANNHPYVGWQEGTDTLGNTFFRQSGVLIDPHWVLTSAHGTLEVDSDPLSTYQNIRMGFGSNYFTNPGESMFASEVYVHPTYNNSSRGYDLALLYFENPFTSVAPITIFEGTITKGMDSDIVGFGRYKELGDTDQVLTGDRRAGNNVIAGNDPLYENGVITRLTPANFSTYRPLGMGATHGDSGGGLFIDGELAAITKRAGDASIYGNITGYTLVDLDWVSTTMASRAVPEPNSFLLFLLTSPFLLSLRSRRSVA